MNEGRMFTIIDWVTGAETVWQVMVKVDCAVMVIEREPERLVDERPGPDTTQLDTSEELQVIREVPPACTRAGLALMVACGWRTVTVAMFEFTEPPGPVQET